MSQCIKCNCTLDGDDIGIFRKLINRRADQFLCKLCLARNLGVTEEQIQEKIKLFKKQGCMLFPVDGA